MKITRKDRETLRLIRDCGVEGAWEDKILTAVPFSRIYRLNSAGLLVQEQPPCQDRIMLALTDEGRAVLDGWARGKGRRERA